MHVSVCVATYNGENFIKEQLDSILSQLSDDDEIIISDDGSEDKTLEIVRTFNDSRIKIFVNKGKHGVVSNFENALKQASGDFIFLCVQDDIWEFNKVDVCMSYLQDFLLIVHDASLIDKEGREFEKSYFRLRKSKTGYINNLIKNSYLGCCMAFRKELLRHLFPFPDRIEMHDRWIGLQAEIYGNTTMIPQQLSRYRIHGNNVSNSTQKSVNSWFTMISIRWWLAYYTCKYLFYSRKK